MISTKAKFSAIEQVLHELRFEFRECSGLDDLICEIRAQKAALAAQIPEPSADGKIGKGDFRKAVRPVVEQKFLEKFGPPPRQAIQPSEANPVQMAADSAVKTPIRLRSDLINYFPEVGEGMRRAAQGDFTGLPANPSWSEVLFLAGLINGYEVIKDLSDEHIQTFHLNREMQFEKDGVWSGTALELWVVLFYYNRINHWNTGYGFEEGEPLRMLANSAYQTLRTMLMNSEAVSALRFEIAK